MKMLVFVLTIVGILCLAYGIVVRLAGSGTMFFAVWLIMGGGLLLLALMIRSHFYEGIPRIILGLFTAAVFILTLSVCICEGFIIRGFFSDYPKDLTYLIVLGAQVRENGPSSVLAHRLDAAAEYLRENPGTMCIVSGGRGYNEPASEGSVMKQYLIEQGIDAARIKVEEKSKNTVQNLQYSKEFLPSSDVKVGLVTSNFHITRAVAIARKQGLTDVYGIPAQSDWRYLVNNMFREYFGVMKDALAGNLAL